MQFSLDTHQSFHFDNLDDVVAKVKELGDVSFSLHAYPGAQVAALSTNDSAAPTETPSEVETPVEESTDTTTDAPATPETPANPVIPPQPEV